MSFRKIVAITALTFASIVPAAAMAQGERAPCILSTHQITSVTPYQAEFHSGHFTNTELRGAIVHVQASPGLTAEWLRLEIGRHLAAMQNSSMGDCALDVNGVTVGVGSAGAGFDVTLIAKDAKQAEEVLRRARLLA
jgi:hypothetical protein